MLLCIVTHCGGYEKVPEWHYERESCHSFTDNVLKENLMRLWLSHWRRRRRLDGDAAAHGNEHAAGLSFFQEEARAGVDGH